MSDADATPLYSPPPWAEYQTLEWLESCFAAQSIQFMIDCLPMIRRLLPGWPSQETFSVLDVGTGTGAGANLLATLYQGEDFGPRLKVDAIELVPHLKRYADAKFPLINYRVGDILAYDGDQRWDIVVCSHLIEHIEKPAEFASFLAGLARRWVVFYAPWKEKALTPGHVSRIDRRFLRRLGSRQHMIIDSPGWRRSDERARCVAFAVPGRAGRERSVPTTA